MLLALLLTLTAAAASAAEPIFPKDGPKPGGPYSPGVLTKDWLYVAGQGMRSPAGVEPSTTREQVAQCLGNVKSIVEAGGLTMEHVVYTHVYLEDAAVIPVLDEVWKQFFPKNPPARAMLIVAHMPGTKVEINAVAIRDLSKKRSLADAVVAGDRVYVSGALGPAKGEPEVQVQAALDKMKAALKLAGLDFRHLVFVNPYHTAEMPRRALDTVYAKNFTFGDTPARATIQVAGLPAGASIQFTGVAVRNLKDRRVVRPKNMPPSATASPCVFAGPTLYCSAKSGFIPGPNGGIWAESLHNQTRQSFRNLLDGLEEGGLTLDDVVATNVYLDDVAQFASMNELYAKYFTKVKPARTTVEPRKSHGPRLLPDGKSDSLIEISVIAEK